MIRSTAIVGFILAGTAFAQDCDPQGHLDIGLSVQNAQIVTGVFVLDDDGQTVVSPGTRVWGGQYQQNPLDPFFTDDPGFGAVSGSGLVQGGTIGFDVLDDLKYWNGTGTIAFGPVPASEQIRIRLGGQSRFVGTGTGFQAGFNLQTVGAGGTVHVHPSFFLLGADGNAVPASQDGVEATPGIYLLTLRVRTSTAGISPSAPLYIVLQNGAPPCAHCTALNYVGSQLAIDRPRADLNFDRVVDVQDFAQLQACATRAGVPNADPCCQDADIDGDGDVDMDDFGRMQRCFTAPGVLPPVNCAD